MSTLHTPSVWRNALCATSMALALLGCASGPRPELPVQRFDDALRHASEKFAAGDLPKAAAAFAQAERIAALYDRRALRTQALLSMGAVAALREQDAEALQAYTQALNEAQGLSDTHAAGVARAGVADAQRRMGDLAAAAQSYGLALQPTALPAGSVEQLQARMGQALVWHAQGERSAARDALQALETQARASASPVLAGVLANQASLLRDQADIPAAIAKAQEALALDRLASNPMALAADLELLGQLQLAAQAPAEAQDSWERALRIVQTTGQGKAAQRLQQRLQAFSSRR